MPRRDYQGQLETYPKCPNDPSNHHHYSPKTGKCYFCDEHHPVEHPGQLVLTANPQLEMEVGR